MIRLDKFLADCKMGTRAEVKKIIRTKKVTVNGTAESKPETKIDEANDIVEVNGKQICYEKYGYYLFHKPAGCVTATKDSVHRTVMDYFPKEQFAGYSPVGRLDLDTEGLLLITNDGALTHHLISPSHHVPKTYYAKLDGPLPTDAIERFKQGLDIGDDTKTLPAKLVYAPAFEKPQMEESCCWAEVTVYEGRYHQVKRMFQAVGRQVVYLKRESMGGLELGNLKKGEYRKLDKKEVEMLSAVDKGE